MESVEVHEHALSILDSVVRAAYVERGLQSHYETREHFRTWQERIDAAKQLMGRRFTSRLLLAEIAAAAGTSVFHLCRIFRRLTGFTVHRYLVHLRLRLAVDLLSDPRTTLVNAALESGFSSQAHLTKLGRQEFGTTPRGIRLGIRGGTPTH